MRYDLEARFYKKKRDKKPRYIVPMGLISPIEPDYFESMGFTEDPESTQGYLDYIKKNVLKKDLERLTQEEYVSEMLDVYYSPVMFIDGNPYYMTESTKMTKINLGDLKRYFNVTTQNEVAVKIKHMRKDRWHTFEELEKWIKKVLSN